MATRDSTPKYEVVHDFSGVVSHTGISKTDALRFARDSGKGFRVRAALHTPTKNVSRETSTERTP